MIEINYASNDDRDFWFSLDEYLGKQEFDLKVRDQRAYVIKYGNRTIGIMRYNLFWDLIPFLTLINIDETYQKQGIGKKAMLEWENEMRKLGYEMVMTSTLKEETAKEFYAKIGYQTRGSLFLEGTTFDQSEELLLIKVL